MKILSALILLLASSVCSAAVTIDADAPTTRVNGDPITGVLTFQSTVNEQSPKEHAALPATVDAVSGDEICLRALEDGNPSDKVCKSVPFVPNAPTDIKIQIIFNIGS